MLVINNKNDGIDNNIIIITITRKRKKQRKLHIDFHTYLHDENL